MKKTLQLVALLIITGAALTFFFYHASDQFGQAGAATRAGVFSILKCKPGPVEQVDPILVPGGGPSGHVHQFFAAKGIQPVGNPTTRDDMLSGGSTCPLTADTAGYWFPVVYDAQGREVPPIQVNAYYRGRGNLNVFPEDFQAVCAADGSTIHGIGCVEASGSPVGWGCTDREGFATIEQAKPCDKRIIAHIQFKFPKSTNLPKLALHARYPTTAHYISSDGPDAQGGASLHADFWNTWDQEVLTFLVEHCLEGGRSCKGMTDAKLKELGFDG